MSDDLIFCLSVCVCVCVCVIVIAKNAKVFSLEGLCTSVMADLVCVEMML